jgi:isopenicillin-N epimerase
MSAAASRGYVGFSSFHSENVESMLMRLIQSSTPRQRIRFETPLPAPGAEMRRAGVFAIDHRSFVFLNHGAFGAPLRAAQLDAARWRTRCEEQPLRFFDRELLPALVESVHVLATHFGIDSRRVLPTSNATTALNAAMRCATVDDLVVVVRPGYASNLRIAEATGARVEMIQIDNAVRRRGAAAVVAEFAERWPRDAVANTRGRVFLLLEHVCSHDALKMPIDEMVAAVDSERLVVVIDGAHVPGTVDRLPVLLDRPNVFYAGNLHKWFLAPRGAAFLAVPPGDAPQRLRLHAPVTSHGRNGGLLSDFIWDGNRDYSPWLTVPLVCDFWHAFGGERRAMQHAASIADEVERHLCNRWNVEPYGGNNVGVPMRLIQLPTRGFKSTSDDAKEMQDCLYSKGVELPVKSIDGQLFVRCSFALYNTADQFLDSCLVKHETLFTNK